MTTKKRERLRRLICPECGEIGSLREIVYGMPDPENFDFERYAVGRCCISGDGSDPDVQCRACEWSGHLNQLNAEYVVDPIKKEEI